MHTYSATLSLVYTNEFTYPHDESECDCVHVEEGHQQVAHIHRSPVPLVAQVAEVLVLVIRIS